MLRLPLGKAEPVPIHSSRRSTHNSFEHQQLTRLCVTSRRVAPASIRSSAYRCDTAARTPVHGRQCAREAASPSRLASSCASIAIGRSRAYRALAGSVPERARLTATSLRLDASRTRRGGWSHASTFRPCTAPWRRSDRCCWHARRTGRAPASAESLRPGSAPAERASSTRRVPWPDAASAQALASPLEWERPASLPARPRYAAPSSRPSSRLSPRPSSRPSSRPSLHWRSASSPSRLRHRVRCRRRVRKWRRSCHPCTPSPPPGRGRGSASNGIANRTARDRRSIGVTGEG